MRVVCWLERRHALLMALCCAFTQIPQLDPDSASARFRDGSATLDSGKRYVRDLPYR